MVVAVSPLGKNNVCSCATLNLPHTQSPEFAVVGTSAATPVAACKGAATQDNETTSGAPGRTPSHTDPPTVWRTT